MNKLYQEQGIKVSLGSEGMASDIWTAVQNYVGGLWDGKKPIGSVIAFIGPGLLFRLGFPWLAIAYEVANALGFNWIGFWDSIKDALVEMVKGIIHSDHKPTEEEVHSQVSALTDKSLTANIDENKVDTDKLAELATKAGTQSLPKAAGGEKFSFLIKQAGLFGSAARSRGLLTTIFKKVIPWAITTALVSLGFAVAGGAARGAVGITNSPSEDHKDDKQDETSTERQPTYNLKLSPNVSPDLMEFTNNGPGSVWLEQGNINNIQSYLSSWILNAFPELKNEINQIENSPSFIQVENMFKNRNKMAEGLQIYSVPKPFQRKIDIVSYILGPYLKTRKTSN